MSEAKYTAPEQLAGSSAVIAGAASGIGRAAAHRLAGRDVKLMLVDVDDEALADVVSELRQGNARVEGMPLDLGDSEAVSSVVETTVDRFGSIDIAVNCVGITGVTGIRSHEVDLDDFDHVVAVNLRAAFVFSQQILPVMLEQRYGRFLHVASISGKEGNAGMVAYSASKAGLIGMVKAQGKEYAQDGVTINALAPAVILTPLVSAMPEHQVSANVAKIPMGRTGTLEEVADMIEFIVSPKASFCTSFTFDLSGGRATY